MFLPSCVSRVADQAARGISPSYDEARQLTNIIASADEKTAQAIFDVAATIRQTHFGNTTGLCAIINAKSGRCGEDCAFCAQSRHYPEANSPDYPLIDAETVETAARTMKAAGVNRFSIVTSGLGPSPSEFKRLLELIRTIRQIGLLADASIGLVDAERLQRMKQAGLVGYHHNLETSRRFFPSICTTHDYEDDVQVVRQAVNAGLYVCSGGIFGLGETWQDRLDLAHTLEELGVHSVPVNFLHPIPGTPLAKRPLLTRLEAGKIIALYRLILPTKHLRVCGGRGDVYGSDTVGPISHGASGLMVGDYLTTKGSALERDIDQLSKAGLQPEPSVLGS
ncbi:biotin synthase BioB [Desulfovibrio inopinatus]|uniref:biotin synthase BioB n=1 Tax=Desulfovibrio inopinatus TaxID=102109 RepID=UPI0004288579|nr:biotin synthase BioB [Desulfovibrio inopinatus]